jgi:hypothetical protein
MWLLDDVFQRSRIMKTFILTFYTVQRLLTQKESSYSQPL